MPRNKGALKDRDKSVSAGRSKGLVKEYQPRFCNVVINQGRTGQEPRADRHATSA